MLILQATGAGEAQVIVKAVGKRPFMAGLILKIIKGP
jgi:hypothetical protein